MQFLELGEIYAIARSVSGPFHRSQVGEGADGGDRVRGDLDADLSSLQLGEGRHPVHSVQYLDLTMRGLNFEARWPCERRSGQRSLDRVLASECL
jgi:hypothetical protein